MMCPCSGPRRVICSASREMTSSADIPFNITWKFRSPYFHFHRPWMTHWFVLLPLQPSSFALLLKAVAQSCTSAWKYECRIITAFCFYSFCMLHKAPPVQVLFEYRGRKLEECVIWILKPSLICIIYIRTAQYVLIHGRTHVKSKAGWL